MTCLSHWDEFPMVSALVYVLHIGRDLSKSWRKIINCHDSVSYYTTWTLNLERILSLCQNQQKALTYGWDSKVVIYPYGLGHYWWRLVVIGILNRDIMISHGIETMCPIGLSKGHVIMKFVGTVIPLIEFDIYSLELENIIWSYNKWDLVTQGFER